MIIQGEDEPGYNDEYVECSNKIKSNGHAIILCKLKDLKVAITSSRSRAIIADFAVAGPR